MRRDLEEEEGEGEKLNNVLRLCHETMGRDSFFFNSFVLVFFFRPTTFL